MKTETGIDLQRGKPAGSGASGNAAQAKAKAKGAEAPHSRRIQRMTRELMPLHYTPALLWLLGFFLIVRGALVQM